MALLFLTSFLLVSGVMVDGLPEKHHHDNSSFVLTSNRQYEFSENNSEVQVHQDEKKVTSVTPSEKLQRNRGGECDYPFTPVGENCYYFSEEKKTFDKAQQFCVRLAPRRLFQSSLAMLDYSEAEDELLLKEVTAREIPFWVGGKSRTGSTWSWIDNRDIFIYSPYWFYKQPIQDSNQCTIARVSSKTDHRKRSYINSHSCNDAFNFICEVGCPMNFRKIQNGCYFFSEVVGFDNATWQQARDYCQSLFVPAGHYADLAVLGLPTQDTYRLMHAFSTSMTSLATWLGAYKESDCQYRWVDGRSLTAESTLWKYNYPQCGDYEHVRFRVDSAWNPKSWIDDYSRSGDFNHFICQLYKRQ